MITTCFLYTFPPTHIYKKSLEFPWHVTLECEKKSRCILEHWAKVQPMSHVFFFFFFLSAHACSSPALNVASIYFQIFKRVLCFKVCLCRICSTKNVYFSIFTNMGSSPTFKRCLRIYFQIFRFLSYFLKVCYAEISTTT